MLSVGDLVYGRRNHDEEEGIYMDRYMVSIPSFGGDMCLLSRYVNNIQDPYKKLSIMAGFNEWWWKQYSHLFKELLVETLLPLL